MTWNSKLAHQVLETIEAHPETWKQDVWTCGTAHCFAGHAALIANGPFQVEENPSYDPDYDQPHEQYRANRNGETIDIGDEARAALWLSGRMSSYSLFSGENTLNDLKRVVAELDEEYGVKVAE